MSEQREQKECNVNYRHRDDSNNIIYSPELFSWSTALISIRYILYLLKRKAIEGHCHNKSHGVPCLEGQKFLFHNHGLINLQNFFLHH